MSMYCLYRMEVVLQVRSVQTTTSSGSIGPAIEMRHLLRHRIDDVRILNIDRTT